MDEAMKLREISPQEGELCRPVSNFRLHPFGDVLAGDTSRSTAESLPLQAQEPGQFRDSVIGEHVNVFGKRSRLFSTQHPGLKRKFPSEHFKQCRVVLFPLTNSMNNFDTHQQPPSPFCELSQQEVIEGMHHPKMFGRFAHALRGIMPKNL